MSKHLRQYSLITETFNVLILYQSYIYFFSESYNKQRSNEAGGVVGSYLGCF